jgi:hypothetical protein
MADKFWGEISRKCLGFGWEGERRPLLLQVGRAVGRGTSRARPSSSAQARSCSSSPPTPRSASPPTIASWFTLSRSTLPTLRMPSARAFAVPLGLASEALPAPRSTPQRCRHRRRDQLLVLAGAREAVLVHVEHEAVANPAMRRPSPRSSDASAVPYARFTDMWVRPVSLRQS